MAGAAGAWTQLGNISETLAIGSGNWSSVIGSSRPQKPTGNNNGLAVGSNGGPSQNGGGGIHVKLNNGNEGNNAHQPTNGGGSGGAPMPEAGVNKPKPLCKCDGVSMVTSRYALTKEYFFSLFYILS